MYFSVLDQELMDSTVLRNIYQKSKILAEQTPSKRSKAIVVLLQLTHVIFKKHRYLQFCFPVQAVQLWVKVLSGRISCWGMNF